MSRNYSILRAGFFVVLGCLAIAVRLDAGTPLDSRFQETIFANDSANLGSPVRLAWAPDGSDRLFVIRYHGKVQIIQNGQLLPEPFAKMDPIYANGECGLLGICFDPNFTSNHYVYFFVSVSRSEQQIIRYTDNNNVGTDRTVIIDGLPTLGNQHNGGALAVGPDGKLYWAIGDNGDRRGVKDDLTTLASKVGRANLDGSVPNDNPFVDGSGPNNDYIWARGFRNPFEITFQPGTGALWLNVVGNIYEQIFIVPRGAYGGWDEYERNHPEGVLKPVIKYRTNRTDGRNIAADGAVRENNIVTITTADPHGFLPGEKITIGDSSGALSSSFHGTFNVATVLSPMAFTFPQSGSDENSGGGRAESVLQGGSVTGGAFYNSSAFPSEFAGNYFYGDFNSGKLMRAVVDGSGGVKKIDFFVDGIDQLVDVTVGPDGALYYIGHNGAGKVYRLAYGSSVPEVELIVEPSALSIIEGGAGSFTVRLSHAPGTPVPVTVTRVSGDSNIGVSGESEFLFSPANWSSPQTVSITAQSAPDGNPSTASFSISGPGIAAQHVDVTAADVPAAALVISTAALQIREGGSATFTVKLSGPPSSELVAQLTLSGAEGSVAITSGANLTFNSGNYNDPQTVTISALEDSNLSNETASVSITAPSQSERNVQVSITDNDPVAPVISSTPPALAIAGAPFAYQIRATGVPAPSLSLLNGPDGMRLDPATGLLTWTPAVPGEFSVTLQAANGVGPQAAQTFVLEVRADTAPAAVITKPVDGQTVSGRASEWFGDGIDDVGVVQAEFYVDGVLHYTDINNTGHYHFGGEHLHWDTTVLGNGAHRLKFVVSDTKGQTGAAEINVTVANDAGVTGYEADVNPRPLGSGDGVIEIADWVQVGRFVAGLDVITDPTEFQRTDCAPADQSPPGDGVISVADWVQAGRYAAGLDAAMPAGGPTGPVDAKSGNTVAAASARQLRIGNVQVPAGADISWVPVELDALGNENGVGFSLRYDEQQVEFVGARLRTADAQAVLQSNTVDAADGIIGVVVVLPAGRTFAPGKQPVVELGFVATEIAASSSPLAFADEPVRREISDALAHSLPASFLNGTAVVVLPGPRITAALNSSGALQINAFGDPGTEWKVEVSENLIDWTILAPIVIDNDGTAAFLDFTAAQHQNRFYRITAP